jgi:hypothetical protein
MGMVGRLIRNSIIECLQLEFQATNHLYQDIYLYKYLIMQIFIQTSCLNYHRIVYDIALKKSLDMIMFFLLLFIIT